MVKNNFMHANETVDERLMNKINNSNSPSCVNGNPKHDNRLYSLECSDMKRVGAGLKNLGNTCFLNSTLQCLMHTSPLFNFLRSNAHEKSCNSKTFCMTCELKHLVNQCFSNGASSVAPQGILRNLKAIAGHMKWGRQEDAHEFLRYVVDSIQKSSLVGKSKNKSNKKLSITETIFQGDLESQIKCLRCQHVSIRCDPFLDMCIDVKNVPSIEIGLQRFTAAELLQGNNAYMCSNCKKKVKAEKMFRLRKLPRVLTLQLKRYSPFGGKVSSHVRFPEILNLSPYTSRQSTCSLSSEYELYAVLIHEGSSTKSGHYYCHVKGPNNNWYCMNDSHVSPINLHQVLRSQAYILFYKQKSTYLEQTISNGMKAKSFQNGTKNDSTDLNDFKKMPQPNLKPSSSLDSLHVVKTVMEKQSFDSNLHHKDPLVTVEVDNISNVDLKSLQSKTPLNDVSVECPSLNDVSVECPSLNDVSAECPSLNDVSVECPLTSNVQLILNGISPQKNQLPELNGLVTEVRFTSRWKVRQLEHGQTGNLHDNLNSFKSTCSWTVEEWTKDISQEHKADSLASSPKIRPIVNGTLNCFSCPTLEWDTKKDVIDVEQRKDDDMLEELSKKKLTFGRPILTWGGEKSMMDSMDKDESKSIRKRKWDEMDEEIDRGKEKKLKNKKYSRNIGDAFQIHANRYQFKSHENGFHGIK